MFRPCAFILSPRVVNWLFAALILLTSGCASLDSKFLHTKTEPGFATRYSPMISGFLTLKDVNGPASRIELASIEILADNLWLPLLDGPITLDSSAIGNDQILLGSNNVSPGIYRRLRLTVTRAEVKRADGDNYDVIVPDTLQFEIPLFSSLELEEEDSRSLLFTWDTEGSLLPDSSLRPALSAMTPVGQLPVNLLFVTCPDIDTIFVIRTDKNWVVDSFGLKGDPTYLALDTDSIDRQLYVLTPKDREIKIINLSTYRLKEFFQAPLNDKPTVMAVSPDGRVGFLLDESSGSLSRIDMTTGSTLREQLGYRPRFMTYLNELNMLAVSLSLTQQVVILDPVNLRTIARISTGRSPFGITVEGNQLYVAESQGDTVSVIDLNTRKVNNQISVGIGPSSLQQAERQVYVSNSEDGSLSVLVPSQLGEVQRISGMGIPRAMAYDNEYKQLYVVDENAQALTVINTVSNQIVGRISLGARPLDLVVLKR